MPDLYSNPSLIDFLKDIGAGSSAPQGSIGPNVLYQQTLAGIKIKLLSQDQRATWDKEVAAIDAVIGGFSTFSMQKLSDTAKQPAVGAVGTGLHKYGPIAIFYARKYGLNPALILSQIQHESNFDPTAVSPTGAQGLMQIEPDTARGLKIANVFDPVQNIDGGCRYDVSAYGELTRLTVIDQSDKDYYMLAVFNAGPGGVSSAIRHARRVRNLAASVAVPYVVAEPFLPAETRNYVKAILRDASSYIAFVANNSQ